MEKNKLKKLIKWKRIKKNGAIRKKRRDLIARIISPRTENLETIAEAQTLHETPNSQSISEKSSEDDGEIIFQPSYNYPEIESEIECESVSAWANELDDDCLLSTCAETIQNRNLLLKQGLAHWSSSHRITREALGNLLEILNENIPEVELPKDPRSITKTPTEKVVLSYDNFGGEYWHYGLEKALTSCLIRSEYSPVVKLNINIDGLPLFKNSRAEFWPILFNIHEKPEIKPMVIGLYFGKSK